MNKFIVLGGFGVVVCVAATLETAGRTAGPGLVSESRRIDCLGLSGTVTTQGADPDIGCLTGDDSGRLLLITTRATPAPSGAPEPSPPSTTQASSSRTVIVEQNSQSSSGGGNTSNTNHSTTNVTITNR